MASARRNITVRVPETEEGLQGDELAWKYDDMQRHIRDRGWLQEKVEDIVNADIDDGTALELGCGPGYLGLEWMTHARAEVRLVGLDISEAMLRRARHNAEKYGLASRCRYDLGTVLELPYENESFDHAFSASSLHEWVDPAAALREMRRVLRTGGRFCISDLRRDIDRTTLQFMKANIAADMRPGFRTSVRSSYIRGEVEQICQQAGLAGAIVKEVQMGIVVSGMKATP